MRSFLNVYLVLALAILFCTFTLQSSSSDHVANTVWTKVCTDMKILKTLPRPRRSCMLYRSLSRLQYLVPNRISSGPFEENAWIVLASLYRPAWSIWNRHATPDAELSEVALLLRQRKLSFTGLELVPDALVRSRSPPKSYPCQNKRNKRLICKENSS